VVPGPSAVPLACADEPWVTGAETCELVLALDAIGDRPRAREMFAGIQFLRDPDGGYWIRVASTPTGSTSRNERSGYTSAAVILAADALSATSGGSGLFRAMGADTATAPDPGHCGCGENHRVNHSHKRTPHVTPGPSR